MPQVSKRAIAIRATFLLSAVLAWPAAAGAGSFTVSGSCGLWQAYNNTPAYLAVYPSCPELVTRNSGASTAAPPGAEGGWIFYAPGGTSVASFAVQGALLGTSGWQAALIPSTEAHSRTVRGRIVPVLRSSWDCSGGIPATARPRSSCGSAAEPTAAARATPSTGTPGSRRPT
jgi:hypothetical protein